LYYLFKSIVIEFTVAIVCFDLKNSIWEQHKISVYLQVKD